MMPKKEMVLVAVLILTLALVGVVSAQVSTNYDLSWKVFSSGGGSRASAHFQVGDTLGQWAAGTSASSNVKVEAGFWYGAGANPIPPDVKLFLPLISR